MDRRDPAGGKGIKHPSQAQTSIGVCVFDRRHTIEYRHVGKAGIKISDITVVRAMDDLVHQGKVLYWGTSVRSAAQIKAAVGIARALNDYPPQVKQPRYNMLDRHIEPEILPTCARHGIGVTAFSPLAQGLLTGKYNEGVPSESRAARSDWLNRDLTEENIAKARRLTTQAKGLGLEPSHMP